MTAVTPSTVTELSATFVARISFRCAAGEIARSCSLGDRLPCRGSISNPARRATASHSRIARRISAAPGRNARMSPECCSPISSSTASLTCTSSGLGEYGRCCDRKLEQLSLGAHDGATAKILRNRIGIEGRRHHHNSQIGPRPLQALQQCQREIAFKVALMELVEHDGGHALQRWIGKQAPGQYALGDKAQARARANRFFKSDLVADGLAELFAELPCHSPRRQPCRNPARFEHNHFAAQRSQAAQAAPGSSSPRPAGLRSQG